jgi:hypothetical protein
MVLRPYEKSSVARKLMAVDRKLFASKGIDMTGIESIAPDQVFDKVIKGTLAGDSPLAVKQLKQILGVTDSSYDILKADGSIDRTVKYLLVKNHKQYGIDTLNNGYGIQLIILQLILLEI